MISYMASKVCLGTLSLQLSGDYRSCFSLKTGLKGKHRKGQIFMHTFCPLECPVLFAQYIKSGSDGDGIP